MYLVIYKVILKSKCALLPLHDAVATRPCAGFSKQFARECQLGIVEELGDERLTVRLWSGLFINNQAREYHFARIANLCFGLELR